MYGFKKKSHSNSYADGGPVEDEAAKKPAPQPASPAPKEQPKQPEPLPPESLGNGLAAKAGNALKNRRAQIDAAAGFANGGMVRGPGSGTSDDIKAKVPEGTYIMPADSTEQIGEKNLGGLGFSPKVPVNLSNGEYELPPEQVHAVGVQALDQMKDATHTPVQQAEPKGFNPELFFADGGEVEDPLRRRTMYVNSSGQASNVLPSASREVVPYQQPNTQLTTTAQPAASAQAQPLNNLNQQRLAAPPAPAALPAPERGPMARPEPNYQGRAETMARAKADTAQYLADKAMQDAKFNAAQAKPAAPAAGFRAGLPRMGVGGALGGAASAIPEAVDVYDVAKDPNSTGIDVATQAAEGVSRTAAAGVGAALGAKGGAALGAFGGPFAPVTVPVGALLGGVAGGALGYFGADKAIETGRSLTGSDPSSPVDRVQRPPQTQPSAASPALQQGSVTPSPTANPVASPQTAADLSFPVQSMDNNVTRVGNSFSGRNIGMGFTVNGRPAGESIQPRSAQNEAAVNALFARTPDLNSVPASVQPQAAPAGFNPGGNMTVIRDSSADDRARQQLIRAASTPIDGARGLTANQRADLRALTESDSRNQLARDTNAENNAARLTEAQMQTDSANARALLQESGANRRAEAANAIDGARLMDEREARGFQTRAAARVERLYDQYDKASPEQKSVIAQQIRELTSSGGSNQNLRNNFITRRVPAFDGSGQVIGEQEEIVDLRTGQPLGAQANSGAPKAGEQRGGYRFKGGNPADQNNWEKI